MTEEGQAAAAPGDVDAQARWRAARAKVLARGGQFPAARALLDEAAALVSPTSWAALQAEILLARAEVDRLAGAPEQAGASLRAALRIYQDRHVTPLADQATAALASLTGHPSAKLAGMAPAMPGMDDLRADGDPRRSLSHQQRIGVVPTSEQRRLIRRRDCSDLSLDRPAW